VQAITTPCKSEVDEAEGWDEQEGN
jgi:hypothetical protein